MKCSPLSVALTAVTGAVSAALFLPSIAVLLPAWAPPALAQQEAVIDAVIASVDGKPITLLDVARQLRRPSTLSIDEVSSDPEARAALEFLILEQLILREAEAKKIGVSNSEIDEYINEVASRNNLSREGFEAALMSENKSIDDYKRTLKLEILRSKLTANFMKDSVAVSEQEIDAYLEDHPELTKSGSKIKLRQILIGRDSMGDGQARSLLESLKQKCEEGEQFAELARSHSESPEAAEGGSLGLLADEDLSRAIFDAVFSLKEGEVSEVVETAAGYHLFQVEQRIIENGQSDSSRLREEIRKNLLNQKMQERMHGFFANEIYKSHTVDKKI
ncbi:MAG: peptidylprolyl isomerase [Deltaproteobacteria bacterium]|nr:peptidylprolyl isomerase [Deltaproteobacteria bacterium]